MEKERRLFAESAFKSWLLKKKKRHTLPKENKTNKDNLNLPERELVRRRREEGKKYNS